MASAEIDQETQSNVPELVDDAGEHQDGDVAEASEEPKKKREKKETAPFIRDAGKSLLPFSRVQKIIKADKEIPIIARDATFLISLAAEEFIKRLCQAGQRAAERERRATVQQKDLATVVRKADEFMFLDEIISLTQTEPQKRVPKALAANKSSTTTTTTGPTLLDQFVKANAANIIGTSQETQDIVMNADGSMVGGGTE